MHGTKLLKIVAATALAVAALGATPLAQAGVKSPQKHPDIIAVLKHPDIIGVLKHPDIIGVLKQRDRILTMRKAGGDN